MLVEFTVGNYRSFKDKVTLSMVAAPINEHQDNNTHCVTDKLRLLNCAVLYGANASGKSNLIKALDFMIDIAWSSAKELQANEKINVQPFLLDTLSIQQPSFFEIVIMVNGTRYRYGFEITATEVVSEWLYFVPTRKEAKLYERHGSTITLGDHFKEGKGLDDKTRNNALFLSVVAQFNGEITNSLMLWFLHSQMQSLLGKVRNVGKLSSKIYDKLKDPAYKNLILDFLKTADLGISNIIVQSNSQLPPTALGQSVPQNTYTILSSHAVFDQTHKHVETTQVDFASVESEGTKKILILAIAIIDSLKYGNVLFIDELESRLHPLLTRKIIRLFNSKESNSKGAQLIFSTHDTNLLDHDFFRRDQIWFVEKDLYAASQLYSLVEYKVRKDALYNDQYISGRYGAIPFLGNFESIFKVK